MIENIKISVIVPIYNVELYVRRCINSIINQQYSNLEIILVDDGSTDSSGLICDEYLALDNRIRVVHKKNGGLVSARKAGAIIASGDYIANVDGDDWIEEDYFLTFVIAIEREFPSILWSVSYIKEDEKKLELQIKQELRNVDNLEDSRVQKSILSYVLGTSGYQNEVEYAMWVKLIKRDTYTYIQNCVPNDITRGEDVFFSLKLMEHTRDIRFLRNDGYHYVRRSSSYTNNKSAYDIKSYIALEKHMQCFKDKNLQSLAHGYITITYMMYFFGSAEQEKYPYLYPFREIQRGSQILVYGAGSVGENIVGYLNNCEHYKLVAWIDGNEQDKVYGDVIVKNVSSILDLQYDYVILATNRSLYIKQMRQKLKSYGIDDNKIVSVL